MVDISLTTNEMFFAAVAGVMRAVDNIRQGRHKRPRFGAGMDSAWQLHIEGAMGEMVVAKYTGVYWDGKGTFRASDVGVFEVRTARKHTHSLILHDADKDDSLYWLVTGGDGLFRVHGFIRGKDGKNDDYWDDPVGGRGAYFVPQRALRDPASWRLHA